MTESLDELCTYLCDARYEALSESAQKRATQVVADTLPVIAAGAAEPEMRALASGLITTSSGKASVLGTGARAGNEIAAFLNGTAGTFLELDEGNLFGRGHPGIHALPAPLAFAETHGCSGPDFLLAVTLGYEVGARIGKGSRLRRGIHPHGTWGTVAAAVAVAKLADASVAQMREVINVASSLGLANSDQTMLEGATVRNTFAGFSAQNGLRAWSLVEAGFTGERDGLGSVWGKVLSDSWNPEALTEALGTHWEITRNYFKRHACCRYIHAALDVLIQIRAEQSFTAADIDEVEVLTSARAARLCDPAPTNPLAGKFSLPFSVATTLVNGNTGVQSFTQAAIEHEGTRALAACVKVREDPKLTAMTPALMPAQVTVVLKDGSRVEGCTETNRGDAEDPYNAAELAEKFFELTDYVWPREVAESLFARANNLQDLDDVNQLTRPLDGIIRGSGSC